MNAAGYVGSELTVFAEARRWKSYWYNQIARYIYGTVLGMKWAQVTAITRSPY